VKKKKIIVGEDRIKEKKEKKKRKTIELVHDIQETPKKKNKYESTIEDLNLSSIETKSPESSNNKSFQNVSSISNTPEYFNSSIQEERQEVKRSSKNVASISNALDLFDSFQEDEERNLNKKKRKNKKKKKIEEPMEEEEEKELEIPERDYTGFNSYNDEPKVGRIIAYQKYELSQLGTPQISKFKEGKILSYNPNTKVIKLLHLFPPNEIELTINGMHGNMNPLNEKDELIVEEIFDKLFNVLEVSKPKVGDTVKIVSGEYENSVGKCIGLDEKENTYVIKIKDNHIVCDLNRLILQ
jgi:hypothetical protein